MGITKVRCVNITVERGERVDAEIPRKVVLLRVTWWDEGILHPLSISFLVICLVLCPVGPLVISGLTCR